MLLNQMALRKAPFLCSDHQPLVSFNFAQRKQTISQFSLLCHFIAKIKLKKRGVRTLAYP